MKEVYIYVQKKKKESVRVLDFVMSDPKKFELKRLQVVTGKKNRIVVYFVKLMVDIMIIHYTSVSIITQ